MKLDAYLDIIYNASTKSHTSKPIFSQISCAKDNSNKNILMINSSNKALTTKYPVKLVVFLIKLFQSVYFNYLSSRFLIISRKCFVSLSMKAKRQFNLKNQILRYAFKR